MHKKPITADFLVIGGGVIGINVARNLKRLFADAKIILLEKEKQCGQHASGRNSGVLHAGFYYTPDSLKAKFTRVGNAMLTAYCEQKKIPLYKCGKLVVAKDANDLVGMDELLKRGRTNGVDLQLLTADEARKIEPRAITYERALFSPSTSSVYPQQVIDAMQDDAHNEGIHIHCGVRYLKRERNNVVTTTAGKYEANYVVNAAGLYADHIAKDFDFSKNYRILPFKGLYLYSEEPAHSFNTHIYPVPDLKNPFLGVHFTLTASGKVKMGPTAIPAFWREQYQGLEGFKWRELVDIVRRQAGLFAFSQFDFKKLAVEELKKYSPSRLVELGAQLATGIKKENFKKFAPPGIRAQLLNVKERKLEMDFILEGNRQSMHILNAVSPGFTSCLPFSHYVCEQIASHLNA